MDFVDWRARRRLQWEQRELKAPQERSDEEIEAVPAESVRHVREINSDSSDQKI